MTEQYIAYLQSQVDIKRKYIEKLNICKTELIEIKSDYGEMADECMDPALSASTWHGTLATQFDNIRRDGFQAAYIELTGEKVSELITSISQKITEIQQEIASLQASIMHAQQELNEQKELEKLNVSKGVSKL
ncbi:YwqH-like family protein [Priestia koreensis]|uniref:Uncharacterized protein n=1 Tax=Priestia koreensis TaxID=284581 RepID=A0A0M0KW35_9BACI|nr:DUF5082 family protein [Priestia koreensis]KOO43021.1 hypothetical protein AMD01_17995 [Priestia koreensis]MCM3003603.1 DUF5082 domain-containing protein [Priestia koreensis]